MTYPPKKKGTIMHRLRSILLTGLVALLMVGMVTAGDLASADNANTVDDGGSIYLGVWDSSGTECVPSGGKCLHVGLNFDLSWLLNWFN